MRHTAGRAGSMRRHDRRRRGFAARPVLRMLAVEFLRVCQKICQVAGQRLREFYRSIEGAEHQRLGAIEWALLICLIYLPICLIIWKGMTD